VSSPRPHEPFVLEIAGLCMRPLLLPGDELRWRRLGPGEPRLGDILVFVRPEALERAPWALSAHRYLWRRRGRAGWEYWTRGDATRMGEEWTPASAVAGIVTARRRPGGEWTPLEGPWERLSGLASAARLLLAEALGRRPGP
jgi:hypothetical protein